MMVWWKPLMATDERCGPQFPLNQDQDEKRYKMWLQSSGLLWRILINKLKTAGWLLFIQVGSCWILLFQPTLSYGLALDIDLAPSSIDGTSCLEPRRSCGAIFSYVICCCPNHSALVSTIHNTFLPTYRPNFQIKIAAQVTQSLLWLYLFMFAVPSTMAANPMSSSSVQLRLWEKLGLFAAFAKSPKSIWST